MSKDGFLPVKIDENALHSEIDIDGETIQIGSCVRSYSFAFGLKGNDRPLGLEDKGERASWFEGIVRSIGEIEIEGCPRYKIEVKLKRSAGEITEATERDPEYVYPPVNGTRSILGGVTCGVLVIHLPDDWDNHEQTSYLMMPESCIADFFRDHENMLKVERDGDQWWLGSQHSQGSQPYASERRAKSDAEWEARCALLSQEESLLEEAKLPDTWEVDMADGLAFQEKNGTRAIEGERQGSQILWRGWVGETELPTLYATIEQAYDALNTKEAA